MSKRESRPIVELDGADGNAYAIIGACRRSARKAGWTGDRIKAVCDEMTAGDYDHLIQVAMKHFEVT